MPRLEHALVHCCAVGLIGQPPSLVRAGTVLVPGAVVVTGCAGECVDAGPAPWTPVASKTGLHALNRHGIVH